jgi:miniconductance mechanosensitive channel
MAEVDKYNQDNEIDKSLAINGRNITNLGCLENTSPNT